MEKEELYRWIKIGGLVSSIPFILISGPIVGYVAGDCIRNFFHLANYVVYIFILIGFVWSFSETAKIIVRLLKINKRY